MSDAMISKDNASTRSLSPSDAAKFLRAFAECSPEIQDVVLEMSEILVDDSATPDEREVAFDALVESLFPGDAADILQRHHEHMASATGVAARRIARSEEEEFSSRLRKLMEEKGITQEALATAAGIGQPAVSNILNRRCRPQQRTIQKFAEALGVPPSALWPHANESLPE